MKTLNVDWICRARETHFVCVSIYRSIDIWRWAMNCESSACAIEPSCLMLSLIYAYTSIQRAREREKKIK